MLERISNLDEPESRDSWWTELRMEIRSHCRSICCNVILGYEEHTTICDDVCILSATGTAAVVNSAVLGDTSEGSSKFNLVPLPDGKGEKDRPPVARSSDGHPHNVYYKRSSRFISLLESFCIYWTNFRESVELCHSLVVERDLLVLETSQTVLCVTFHTMRQDLRLLSKWHDVGFASEKF